MRDQFDRDGFVVVPTGVPEETLRAATLADGPLQPKEYHWNPAGRRVFEGWKSSQAVRDIAYAPALVSALHEVADHPVRPFQTINFDRGSAQRAHADLIHFDSRPAGQIVGAWVALEDIHLDSGPLFIVPGSHGAERVDFETLGLPPAEVGQQYEEYRLYEDAVERLIEARGWARVPMLLRAGQAVVFGGGLLHGGMPIADPERTRYSVAIHYFAGRMEYAFAPMFGTAEKPYRKSMRWFDRAGQSHPWERNRVRPMISYGSPSG